MEKTDVAGLIARCREGDSQAQEALILAVQNRIYYHCKKMLKNEDDALDATQEVLISMLGKLDTLKEPAAFWGWLSAMTANHCRNALTRGSREVQIPEDENGNSLLDTYETLDDQAVPDKALDSEESRRMIVELIDALPAAQRQCVLMYYYEEMGVKEIAAALDTSEGTVKSRLNYARKAIKAGVDRYAAQGIKLYSLAPLPFLAYILKQDALLGGLTAAQSGACVQAALAGSSSAFAAGAAATAGTAGAAESAAATAGVAGAAEGTAATAGVAGAAEGAAVAGTAGSGASASAGHILGAVLAHKGAAAAVAGVVLAGAIGGGVLLANPEPEAEQPAPPPVVEVYEPVEEVPPEIPPEPDPVPVEEPEPEPQPQPEPEPQPQPEPEPEPEPQPEPEPEPEPEPQPEPEPEPEPETTQPPQVTLAFDSASDGYGAILSTPISVYSGKTPFDSIVYSSSNPSVVQVGERGTAYLLKPGQADIILTFPQDGNYQLRIPVTVEDHFKWDPTPPSSPVTLYVGQTRVEGLSVYGTYNGTTLDSVTWTSSNPSVAEVESSTERPSALVTAVSPGTTTITATVHFTITAIGYQTSDTFSFDVVVEER